MQVWTSIADLAEIPGPVVLALGVFDGVHLGHQAVLAGATTMARRLGGSAVATTFHPHPRRVLRPDSAPLLLTSPRHQQLLLSRLGVGHLLSIPFTAEFASSAAGEFIDALVAASRPLGGIVTGTDFCFGRERSGNAAMLAAEGARRGFTALAVPPVMVDGSRVSSTQVRQAVQARDFERCEHLLGRPHSVLGNVITGRQLGRTLGFPTANIDVEDEQLPPSGVYAVEADIDGTWWPAVANLGCRPTVEADGRPRLEVHVLDFQGDLYGRMLETRFRRFLRPERTFENLAALTDAIARDVAEARKVFATTPAGRADSPPD